MKLISGFKLQTFTFYGRERLEGEFPLNMMSEIFWQKLIVVVAGLWGVQRVQPSWTFKNYGPKKKIKYNTHPPLKLQNYMLLLFFSSVHL